MLNNNEIWKPVVGFEKFYEVSNLGQIRNMYGKILSTHLNNRGYEMIDFTVNKVRTKKLVHRVVMETFTQNIKNYPEVNHKDENKANNCLENLEWCTRSYNKQHSMKTGTYNKIYETKNTLGKKHLPNTKSKYHNVTYDKNRNKWVGQIRHEKKNWYMKRFNTEVEAALHVNWIIDKLELTDRPKNGI